MSKNIKVVLKSLATIINEAKGAASVDVDSDGKIIAIYDARVHNYIVSTMIPMFLKGEPMEIHERTEKDFRSVEIGLTWYPEWVKEFIEPTPEVKPEKALDANQFKGGDGESLKVRRSCCGCPLLFLDVEGSESVSFHINDRDDAVQITKAIMDVVSGCSMKPRDFTGRYESESLKVRKSCSGHAMLIIEDGEGDSEVFHIKGGRKDAERINKLIMDAYAE